MFIFLRFIFFVSRIIFTFSKFQMPEFCWHDHSRFREIIKDYQYMDVKEDRSIMNEEFFDNENWYIRLLMEATDRMEINQTKVASNHRLVSYSDYADDRILLLDPASDFLDQYIEKEMVRDFLGCLTARQKEIIQLFYFEEMNQEKIADYLGIRQQSVCE